MDAEFLVLGTLMPIMYNKDKREEVALAGVTPVLFAIEFSFCGHK